MSGSNNVYEYNGIRGFHLKLDAGRRVIDIGGSIGKKSKADVRKQLSFDDIRKVRTFVDRGVLLTTQGIEFEINDLDSPLIRVVMSPGDQSVWMARLGQACDLA